MFFWSTKDTKKQSTTMASSSSSSFCWNNMLLILLLLVVTQETTLGFSSEYFFSSSRSSNPTSTRTSTTTTRRKAAAVVVAPETISAQRQRVQTIINTIYGDDEDDDGTPGANRRVVAAMDASYSSFTDRPKHELVYGELGLTALATVLDAATVQKGDVFMDIGSGDGVLVMAAAMLYSEYIQMAVGLEIVPALHERSLQFLNSINNATSNEQQRTSTATTTTRMYSPIEFLLGDIYSIDGDSNSPDNVEENNVNDKEDGDHHREELLSNHQRRIQKVLEETTIAVCFATTWSTLPGKRLPHLSKVLASHMQEGARIVIIDGRLDCEDGYNYQGELRIDCPDTAPYSTAHLYIRT